MNAAIRGLVRTGLDQGWEEYGVRNGYAGLITGQLQPLRAPAHRGARRSRSAFAITETDERLIAALASIGERRRPKLG